MAGIGFELQKVLKKGGMSGIFKAALAGIIIVAGPWLISIVGIFFLYRIVPSAINEGGLLFTSAIVYSYAFSLFMFGGIHYIFTRYIADMIFIKKHERALATLFLTIIGITVLSGLTALITVSNLNISGLSYPFLFKISAVLLFITINLIWLVMIFITLLKKYMTISLIYLGGMGVSIFAAYFLGRWFMLSGALAGFCIGQLIILLSLLFLIISTIRPSSLFVEIIPFLQYFGRFKFLLLTGLFYSAGIWADKVMLWFLKGESVYGTFIHLFAEYDMPVYLANLTIIPGLVYFMIFSESNFYVILKSFLLHLNKSNLTGIIKRRHTLQKTVKRSMYEQALFQGVITLSLIIMAPEIKLVFIGHVSTTLTLRIVFAALFFNLMLLTSVTFLFYLEKYKEAFISVFLFFSLNLIITFYGAFKNCTFYGIGYLTAGLIGTALALLFLFHGIKTFDRVIFSRF